VLGAWYWVLGAWFKVHFFPEPRTQDPEPS